MTFLDIKIDECAYGEPPAKQRGIFCRSKIIASLGALPIALVGCGDPNYTQVSDDQAAEMIAVQTTAQIDQKRVSELIAEKKALIFPGNSPESCIKEGTFGEEACTVFFNFAKEAHYSTAKQFPSIALCEIEHPSCEQIENSDGQNVAIAKMEGYMAHAQKNGESDMNVEPLYLQSPPTTTTASSGGGGSSHIFFFNNSGNPYYGYSGGSPASMKFTTHDKVPVGVYKATPATPQIASRVAVPAYTPNVFSQSNASFKVSSAGMKMSASPAIRAGAHSSSIRSGGFGSVGRSVGGSMG